MNENRVNELITILREHDHAYYVMDDPKISDAEYDSLVKEYKSLIGEGYMPKIYNDITGVWPVISHPRRMYSLDNVFSLDGLTDWMRGILEEYPDAKFKAEYKLDGLSIDLHYDRNILTHAITRGDGEAGEDVIDNIKAGRLYKVLSGYANSNSESEFNLHGEVYLPVKSFEEINKKLEAAGRKKYITPRNAASGILRRQTKDSIDIFSLSKLKFTPYGVFDRTTNTFDLVTYENIVHHRDIYVNIDTAHDVIKKVSEERDNLPYEIDGIVFKVTSRSMRETLGHVGKYPKWAIAYKFPAEEATTMLLDVRLQVGMTGVITPVAIINPTVVGGVTVSRATLHNYNEIAKMELAIGDYVTLKRAGDVVPDIVGKRENGPDRKIIHPPTQCPSCNGPVQVVSDDTSNSVTWKCLNTTSCPDQIIGKVFHACSRKIFNIKGFGRTCISNLVRSGKVQNVSCIFMLSRDDLVEALGGSEVLADKIYSAIQHARKQSAASYYAALTIDGVGTDIAKNIAREYPNPKVMLTDTPSLIELMKIPKVGIETATNIRDLYTDPSRADDAGWLLAALTIHVEKHHVISEQWCITGTIGSGVSRDTLKDVLHKCGIDVKSSVSSNTTLLLSGAGGSASKVKKAKSINIPIIEVWSDSTNIKDILETIAIAAGKDSGLSSHIDEFDSFI